MEAAALACTADRNKPTAIVANAARTLLCNKTDNIVGLSNPAGGASYRGQTPELSRSDPFSKISAALIMPKCENTAHARLNLPRRTHSLAQVKPAGIFAQIPKGFRIMSIRRLLSRVAAVAAITTAGLALSLAPSYAQDAAAASKSDVQNFGTWSMRCEKNDAGEKQCHAFVDVRIGEEKTRIAYIGIGYGSKDTDKNGQKDMFMFAITPLGTFLPAGIGWSIDDKEKFSQQFMYCLPGGCQTEILLTDERLNALKNGKELHMMFRIVGKGDTKIPVSLEGITKALAAVPAPKS
ncbi:MAG: hypothetical protein CVT73_08220 [Alphaproteobacteria bacterium HGW-Alphaproteobacteria-12]|nr:MAG: hypothetical protein CVT73_08220 [Alphaproteobacteria bacterium HGW-Alphaproteobacteria-12]